MYCWYCLYVWCQYLCVFSQVKYECVTGPATFDLHDVERDTPQQVFQSRTDPDAMALKGLQSGSSRGFGKLCKELGFGKGPMPVLVLVREEVTLLWGVVNLEVMS